MTLWHNIPEELRAQKRWVSFQLGPDRNEKGKLKKVPVIPGTDQMASVTDPSTWRTFNEAVAGGNPAFVIDKPWLLLDFDFREGPEMEEEVSHLLKAFPSYAEESTNGGIHIIVRGEPSKPEGCRRDGLEFYSNKRFCIFTGDVLEGHETIRDADPHQLRELEVYLRGQNGVPLVALDDLEATLTDEELLTVCRTVPRFDRLWKGEWQGFDYPSQSEADHNLIAILTRHTESNSQVKRLFSQSGLYRPKKYRKYVEGTIQVVRTEIKKEKEAEEFCKQMMSEPAPPPVPKSTNIVDQLFDRMPPGLIKDCYQSFLDTAHHPLKGASFIAALTTAIALFGRNYQTCTEAGLNLWLFLVAPASSGKDTISKGPRNIFKKAGVTDFDSVLGGQLRSDSGIEVALFRSPNHIAHHGDCATWLSDMCSDKAVGFKCNLRDKLMEVYTLADHDNSLSRVSNKDAKDHKKGELSIERPTLTITGDAITGRFYNSISESEAASGFIPRMIVLESSKRDMKAEPNTDKKPFSESLLDRIKLLAMSRVEKDMWGYAQQVPAEKDAYALYLKMDTDMRRQYIEGDDEDDLCSVILTRSALKMLKIATLFALSSNPEQPVVKMSHMQWAVDFIRAVDNQMVSRLSDGAAGSGSYKQRDDILRLLERGWRMTQEERSATGFWRSEKALTNAGVIPVTWIRDRIRNVASFRGNRNVDTDLRILLKSLEDEGTIEQRDKSDAFKDLDQRSALVLVGPHTFGLNKVGKK